ncbi:MAG: SUMF1/EgtB/PvdO family nonheme iron enzyme [Saprospiraceae bacterium]|nr:SUMF1/EgtB/PvdO family nonheme iron enzyme [Saprospiraceae bacterium]
MGIEMVYVPQGSFYVGSGGTERKAFYTHPTTTNPYYITSEAAITVGTADGNFYYPFGSGDQTGPIPAAFPKGYAAIYCMKYEITQSQYVAFLNKLTYAQQVTRTGVAPSLTAGTNAMTGGATSLHRNGIDIMTSGVANITPAVYACNLDNDAIYDEPEDGQSIASNYLSWGDLAAYLDWSALRPMTELEYEKAGRGKRAPVADEYAWGSTSVTGATTITNSGATNEIAQAGANCTYGGVQDVTGPMRSGNFAQAATTRTAAGASYYGIMELSGNLWEQFQNVNYPEGRAFTGINGNGELDGIGNANELFWRPSGSLGLGTGFRGSAYNDDALSLRLSDRNIINDSFTNSRFNDNGGRGCRQAP